MVMASMIEEIKETQEMIGMAGKHNNTRDIELISAVMSTPPWNGLRRPTLGTEYRFVIDVAKTLKPSSLIRILKN